MAAQQPNFVALSQNLAGAAAEIALVPNMPPLAVQNQLNLIVQQLGQLGLQVGAMQGQIGGIQGQLNIMQQQMNGIQAGYVSYIGCSHIH